LIDEIRNKQKDFLLTKSIEEQKKLGQFFTDSPIAEFMSSLIDIKSLNPDEVRLLDCGAGYGILTASTALHLLRNGINNVDATLYEIDLTVIEHLKLTLESVKTLYQEEGKKFSYKIINDDFIIMRPDLNGEIKFDVSVINPPYFKYSVKNSIYSQKTANLFKGDPNIYASFIAITLSTLSENGQAVVISPRSFLNGLYFKGFRKYLLANSLLERIHIFNSRNKVFSDSDILQENIIFKFKKTKINYNDILISTSQNILDLDQSHIVKYPKNIIIDVSNDEGIIRIPQSEGDYNVLNCAEKLPSTFAKEGYFISTGPVVEHRTEEYIEHPIKNKEQVPLIKSHNVFINGVVWHGDHKKDLSFNLYSGFKKHLIPNNRYLIIKRFTSKDEVRRLVAGVLIPQKGIDIIGITNKLNYVGRKDSIISENEALGLSVLFNSVFMDNYYRCISGSTQVNATDIRVMKTPTREQICELGELAKTYDELTFDIIEKLVKNIFK
jgi:adenine-specific DNA-methyltransferase